MDWLKDYGGLQKKKVSSPKPKTIGEIFENSHKNQMSNGINGNGSWYKNGKFTPKVGIHKLWNGSEGAHIMIKESDWNSVMGKMMDSYKKGEMTSLLEDVQMRREKSNEKRRTPKDK